MEQIIQQTELTIVFTREGQIVVPIDEEGKYSFFSKYCVGIRDGYQKDLDREVGFFLVKNHCEDESEYKVQIAEEIGRRNRKFSEGGIQEGFFVGNRNALTDMGQLTNSIYSHQVGEMKRYPLPGYIRDGRSTFYLKNVNNIEIYENVGYRYLLLPKGFNKQNYRGLNTYSIEELENLIKTQQNNCTLDLCVAMRQLDKAKITRFTEELIRQQGENHDEQGRE